MTHAFVRLLTVIFAGAGLVPVVTASASRFHRGESVAVGETAALIGLIAVATVGFYRLLRWMEPTLDRTAERQTAFLDALPLGWVDLAIAGAAALSLFLELSVIRWQATVFEFFAFYKNFGLLACFAGLGLGYALAGRGRIPLVLVIPLLAWQCAVLIALRFGLEPAQLASVMTIPFQEQMNMGVQGARTLAQRFAIYFFLLTVFLTTALAFIPVGQLCGRLMERRPQLRAYGLNLLGSLTGVLLVFLASALWTPPVVWFGVAFLAVLALTTQRPGTLLLGFAAAMVGIAALAWPVNPAWQRIYSPYQLLELSYGEHTGLMELRAAGHYFQRVFDLSGPRIANDPKLQWVRAYYDLPYRVHPHPGAVAIVGAGAGNDVVAALRAGASRVDAIEIDPAILLAGHAHHPEHPYRDRRVNAVVTDARTFLRTTDRTYDMIVYGLLDSHTLLSHASSVRLDSFVYTVEGFREARARLAPGGLLAVSFSMLNDALGHKLHAMMSRAFDGAPPVVVRAGYDGAVVFLQSREGTLEVPGLANDAAAYADAAIHTDVSTDDWPFFYMPWRVYPTSYLVMLGMVLLGAVLLAGNFVGERPRFRELPFLLLGAGFMLVETKAITELGLTFGNTWRVIGIAIAGVLLMAFLANAVVEKLGLTRPHLGYALLLASLVAGWWVAGRGGLPSTAAGRLGTVVLLTMPMFFSGIVFSTLLAAHGAVSAVMAANLLGAMLGGLLEYNSMYFGFRFLYLLALAFYAVALVLSLSRSGKAMAPAPAGAGIGSP